MGTRKLLLPPQVSAYKTFQILHSTSHTRLLLSVKDEKGNPDIFGASYDSDDDKELDKYDSKGNSIRTPPQATKGNSIRTPLQAKAVSAARPETRVRVLHSVN
jgi:hypothetical protein